MESLCHGLNQVEDKLPRASTCGTDSQCMWRTRRQGAIRQPWSNPSLKATTAKARAWLLPISAARLCTMWRRKKTESPSASTSPAAPPWWCTGEWRPPRPCRLQQRRHVSSCPSSPPRTCPCSPALSWSSFKGWSTSWLLASLTSVPCCLHLARGMARGLPSSRPCCLSRQLTSAGSPCLPRLRKRRVRSWSSFRDMSTKRAQRMMRRRSRQPASSPWKTHRHWHLHPLSGIRWLQAAPCPVLPCRSRYSAHPQTWPMLPSSWGIISRARPPYRAWMLLQETWLGGLRQLPTVRAWGGVIPRGGGEGAESRVVHDRAKTLSCT